MRRLDMSATAIESRLRDVARMSDLSPQRRLDAKLDMSPRGITARLREAGALLRLCRVLHQSVKEDRAMMNRPSELPEVNVETMKLLLQVAWADDALEKSERDAIQALGPAWGVPDDVMEHLLERLDMGKPLPQPNLSLLRQHKEAVMAAAVWFVGVDGVIDDTEEEFLETVQSLLGG